MMKEILRFITTILVFSCCSFNSEGMNSNYVEPSFKPLTLGKLVRQVNSFYGNKGCAVTLFRYEKGFSARIAPRCPDSIHMIVRAEKVRHDIHKGDTFVFSLIEYVYYDLYDEDEIIIQDAPLWPVRI